MAGASEVRFAFVGDDSKLQKTFDDVGSGARGMAKDIDKASDDARGGFDRLGEGVDSSESKFRGLGDTISGTGDIMTGFKEGDVVGLAMGFADLAGGLTDFVLPAFTAVRGFITTSLIPSLTAIATHPVFIAIAVGGAIIAGLILLEKKFGVVTGAINLLKDAASTVFNVVKDAVTGAVNLIRDGWNATVGGKGFSFGGVDLPGPFDVPGFSLRIPTLHTGGMVPGPGGQNVVAMLQAGETIVPRGARPGGGITIVVQGSVITERDLGRVIADQLRNNRLLGVT